MQLSGAIDFMVNTMVAVAKPVRVSFTSSAVAGLVETHAGKSGGAA